MPSQDFTYGGDNTGNNQTQYTWTAPFACKNVTATCIGGGGSGYKDKNGDEDGTGGGGGGFARATRTIPGGTNITIRVGSGGAQPGNNNSNPGKRTSVIGGNLSLYADGGNGGTDNNGGVAGGGGSISGSAPGDIYNNGGVGRDDDSTKEGGGAGNENNNSGYCGSNTGGAGTNLAGSSNGCPGGRNGRFYGGGGAGNNNGGEAGAGADGAARLVWDYYAPVIDFFTASTQTSGTTGVPSDEITFTWSTQYADSLSINQGVGSVTNLTTKTINSGLQSVVGTNSPASKTYTLTATGPGGTITSNATAYVYNDNTPTSCSAPSTTTSGVSLTNLEPNTTYSVFVSAIQGIDMTTAVTAVSSGLQVSKNNSNFSQVVYITNSQGFWLRFTSDPFNTDPSGLKTSPKVLSYTVGTCSSSITIRTRAPDVEETFDFGDNSGAYPYPDIDQVSNTPNQYLSSPTSVTVDDVDISVEIKTDNSDAQIRIKPQGSAAFGNWQSTRSI